MYKSFSMELAGRTLTVDVGRVAAQANGAAFMHYGDTVVLSTATASEKPREGVDFFPLSVEFFSLNIYNIIIFKHRFSYIKVMRFYFFLS